ncbi:hypothetical protein PIB30_078328 [Stylosanthes scabra]|uniref:Uncharacterized protein n=1 Tax=Stylosanthes scabra TaxID=79078 RepID=A0ABU6SSC2_9FABA|nr:hypothetical protein [Stylosanthes scabra]
MTSCTPAMRTTPPKLVHQDLLLCREVHHHMPLNVVAAAINYVAVESLRGTRKLAMIEERLDIIWVMQKPANWKSLGVAYGGTSPLYVYKTTFSRNLSLKEDDEERQESFDSWHFEQISQLRRSGFEDVGTPGNSCG